MNRYARVFSPGLALVVLTIGISFSGGSIASAADTIQDFTAIFPPPPPSGYIKAGSAVEVPGGLAGAPGVSVNYLRLVADGINDQFGSAGFNQVATNTGAYETLQIDFDFRIDDPGTGADGVGFAYLNTANFGTTGAMPNSNPAEEPNFANSLGVGFDTWNNDGVFEDGTPGTGSLPDSFSLHFNGAEAVPSVPMASLGLPDDWLENGNTKHATILLQPNPGGGVDVSVAILQYSDSATVTPFLGVNIPAMTTYNGRLGFASRTGGENQNAEIDNIATDFTPSGGLPIHTDVQNFDTPIPPPPPPPALTGGTPFSAMQHGSVPGPQLRQDAPGSGVLPGRSQLTEELGSQSNSIAFDKTSDLKQRITADFDIRITDTGAASSADGGGFLLLDTATYGDTGPIPGGYIAYEEPNLTGALGVGFDTFSDGVGFPDFCADCTGNTANAVSLHFNGAPLGEVTFPQSEIDLVSNVYHHVQVSTEEVPGGINVSVILVDGRDGSNHFPFTDFFISGGFTGGVRAAFGARTGGAADLVDIDNVNVAFIPEPSSVALAIVAALAGLGVAYRRRRAAA